MRFPARLTAPAVAFPLHPTAAGRVCRGDFSPGAAALSLSFRDCDGMVSNATYRAVDANSEYISAPKDSQNVYIGQQNRPFMAKIGLYSGGMPTIFD